MYCYYIHVVIHIHISFAEHFAVHFSFAQLHRDISNQIILNAFLFSADILDFRSVIGLIKWYTGVWMDGWMREFNATFA